MHRPPVSSSGLCYRPDQSGPTAASGPTGNFQQTICGESPMNLPPTALGRQSGSLRKPVEGDVVKERHPLINMQIDDPSGGCGVARGSALVLGWYNFVSRAASGPDGT